jgi:hypothetical protein
MDDSNEVLDERSPMAVEETGKDQTGGAAEDGIPEEPGAEKKKTRGPYATHGVFSRAAWKALAKQGEDMKRLGQTERMLYDHFLPRNPFEEFVLDRAWSCILRCILISKEEERVYEAGGKSNEQRLKDIGALASYGGAKVIAEQTSNGLLNELSSVLRYDLNYSREFARWISFLEALQNGTGDGHVFGLPKKAGSARVDEN